MARSPLIRIGSDDEIALLPNSLSHTYKALLVVTSEVLRDSTYFF
jgi:hypothetical protein